jgi:hypothetical protein
MSVRLKTGTQSAGFFKRNTQMTRPAFEPAGIIQEYGSGLIEPYKPHPSELRTLDVLFLFIYLTRVQNPVKLTPYFRRKLTPFRRRKLTPCFRRKVTPCFRRKLTPFQPA